MNILSIDPSIRNIGFAILQVEDKQVKLLHNFTYYASQTASPLQVCDVAYRIIRQHLIEQDIAIIKRLIIEYPQFMMGDKGLIAAQKGYTLDLAMMCGYMAAKFNLGSMRTYFFTPMAWKGTAPKTATQAKFKRTFPDIEPHSEHSVDSAMLGYFYCNIAKLIEPPCSDNSSKETEQHSDKS